MTTVDAAVTAASDAFRSTRSSTAAERASWLTAVADRLDEHADELAPIAMGETHLGEDRLRGELKRTTNQLRLFARVIVDGGYLEATIDHPDATAVPPVPDLRRMLVPLGPVAVFSASNFPFAFSVAGGDTASALATGCPVVAKAHSGHPRLSERTAQLVIGALADAGAPAGLFALVEGREEGTALVQHPGIRAVGFTGSLRGGRALFDLANARPDPIPFYGELGSLNPVLVTPGADAARAEALAAGLAQSFQLGLGQFCTKPGLVFVPSGGGFEPALVDAVSSPAAGELLTPGIAEAFAAGVDEVLARPGVRLVAGARSTSASANAVVVAADVATVAGDPALLEERFGPLTLLITYDRIDEALEVIASLGGSLTATLHAEPDELDPAVVDALTQIAGRVLFSGWPTGVAVSWAQQHGGPWPATTAPHTSVGATSVRRWLRPIAFQEAPAEVLPPELLDGNPLGIPRRVDGVLKV